jgi:hypothetical protein
MRSRGVRSLQWWMVGLTILVALVVGYTTADLLTQGPSGEVGGLQPLPDVTQPFATTPAEPDTLASAAPASAATARPDVAEDASPAPAARVFIDESFDAASGDWPSQTSDRWSAGYDNGRYQLTLSGQTSIGVNARPPDDVTDYSIDVDVAVDAGGAGVVFLFAEPQQSYWLLISSDGAYAIQYEDGDEVVQIRDWTPNDALRADPGATNRLRFERNGATISFFANDTPLTTFDIPDGEWTNRFGLVLTARSGDGSATFDNLRGERLLPNS